jgi:SAM-dependent methyltransferase
MAIGEHNRKAAAAWGGPGREYERVSAHLADAIDHALARLDPKPGERLLDVGTGTGWAARRASARGARAVGIDLGAELVEAARALAAAERVEAEFRVADAEALPFEAGSFDLAVSTFGVMFVSRPEAAAGELARVVRRGGRAAIASWTPESSVAAKFRMTAPYAPGASGPSPFEWGRAERVRELLGGAFDLGFETGVTVLRLPDPAAAWDLFVAGYGPTRALAAALPPDRLGAYRRDFESFYAAFRTPLGIAVPREYLLAVGVRR